MNTDAILGKWKDEIRKTLRVDSIEANMNIADESRTTKENNSIVQDDDDDEPEIKEYTNFVIACLKSMAMQPIFIKNSNWFLDAINLFYIVFVNFTSFHIMIFSLADVLFSWDGNIFGLTFNMIVTVIYATNTLLLLYFQCYSKDLFVLLERLNNTFRFRSAHGLTVLNMTASFRWARFLSAIFTGACIIGAAHWAVLPLFTPAVNGVRMLPLKLWYPMDVQNTPYYEIAYFFQFFGQIMTAMVYANFGILFLSECVLICGQFDILCCSLRNIRFTALRRRGFQTSSLIELAGYSPEGANRCTLPEDEYKQYIRGKPKILDPRLEITMQRFLDFSTEDTNVENTDLKVELTKKRVNLKRIQRRNSFKEEQYVEEFNVNKIDAYEEYRMEVMKVIEDCVHHHQEILDYCQSFERFCSPISLVKMFQITLLACFVMYSFSVSFQITILEYGTLTFWDLFLLCYFGNEVRIRSAIVAQVACSGPWHIMDQKTFKNLVPLILRASRPVSFTGGSFYILNLENMIGPHNIPQLGMPESHWLRAVEALMRYSQKGIGLCVQRNLTVSIIKSVLMMDTARLCETLAQEGVLKASFSYFTVLRNINEAQS